MSTDTITVVETPSEVIVVGYLGGGSGGGSGAVESVNGMTGNVVVTKTTIGLGNVDNTSDTNKPISSATQTALNLKVNNSLMGLANGVATLDAGGKVPSSQLPDSSNLVTSVSGRTGDVIVTKTDVGLGLVNNTSDVDKPVSTATATALSAKVSNSNVGVANGIASLGADGKLLNTQVPTVSFPVTSVNSKTGAVVLAKADVGLGNADNTSDSSKPISIATQTALDAKVNTSLLGANDGVAQLDATGKLKSAQLPTITTVADGDKGDITVTSGAWSIDLGVVSPTKLSAGAPVWDTLGTSTVKRIVTGNVPDSLPTADIQGDFAQLNHANIKQYFIVGDTTAGGGGYSNWMTDSGVLKWRAGIEAGTNTQRFQIYDIQGGAERIGIDPASGQVRLGGSLKFPDDTVQTTAFVPTWKTTVVADFGASGDYIEIVVPTGTSHTSATRFSFELRIDGTDHRSGEEVMLEEFSIGEVSEIVGTSVTVGIYAPYSAWGRYSLIIYGVNV